MPAICHRQIFPLVFQRVRTIDRKLMYFRFYIASGSLGFPFTEPFFLFLPSLSSLFLFLSFFFAILRFKETLSSRLPVEVLYFLRIKVNIELKVLFLREKEVCTLIFSLFFLFKETMISNMYGNIEEIIACDLTVSIEYTKILQN